MGDDQQPTFGNGKICYLEIPAMDIDTSASFFEKVFDWKVRKRGDGSTSFDDGVGQVSGTWLMNKKPATDPEIMIHIMVDDINASMDAVVANGGKIVQGVGAHASEITAKISDPAGNVFGLYQHRGSGS